MNKTVTVIVDPVRYKGPRDTDASMFRVAADKCRRGNDIGGSNLRIEFGRTYEPDEWKGYVHGGKVYYSWAELVRRYGPIENATPGADL